MATGTIVIDPGPDPLGVRTPTTPLARAVSKKRISP
jgi:hypothetical protein